MNKLYKMKFLFLLVMMGSLANCSESGNSTTPTDPITPSVNEVDFWLTKEDQTVKLQKTSYYIEIWHNH